MSGFDGNTILTRKGKNYLARAQTGETLRITEVIMGDGVLGDVLLDDVTEPIHPVISIDHVSLAALDNQYYIEVDYTDAPIPQDFYFREVAVYADLGEGTENTLYSYGYSGDAAVLVRQDGGGSDFRKFRLLVTIDNAPNVVVTIDQSIAYVPMHDKATAEDIAVGTPNKWVDAHNLNVAIADGHIGMDYVPIRDKATPEDIAAGTPGKWLDAEGLGVAIADGYINVGSGGAGAAVKDTFAIPPNAWLPGSNAHYTRYAIIYNEAISSDYMGFIAFDIPSRLALLAEGIDMDGETLDGALRLWCDKVPSIEMVGSYACLGEGGGAGGGTGGGGNALQPATATRLGGVKIGDNLDVTPDGTLSAPSEGASDDQIDEMLEELNII